MTRLKLLALLLALAMCAVESRAATEPAPVAPTPAPQTFTYQGGGNGVTLTLYLVLLLALLGGGTWVARNGYTLFQPKVKGARKLQISETRMLGNRQFLIVAEYEDRKMLLGVCPGRIDYLTTLGGAEQDFPSVGLEKSDE